MRIRKALCTIIAGVLLLTTGCTPKDPRKDTSGSGGGRRHVARETIDPYAMRKQAAEELLARFVTAYNALDIVTMIDCMDPSIGAVTSIASKVFGEILGIGDLMEYLPHLPGFLNFASAIGVDGMPDKPNFTLSPINFTYSESHVMVEFFYVLLYEGQHIEGRDILYIDDTGTKPFIVVVEQRY